MGADHHRRLPLERVVDRGNEIGEGLADSGGGLDEEMAAVGQMGGHLEGHLPLLGAFLVLPPADLGGAAEGRVRSEEAFGCECHVRRAGGEAFAADFGTIARKRSRATCGRRCPGVFRSPASGRRRARPGGATTGLVGGMPK